MRPSQSTRLTRETLLKLDAVKKKLPYLTTYESVILYLLSAESGSATRQPLAVPVQHSDSSVTAPNTKTTTAILMDDLLL